MAHDRYAERRATMVATQIAARGVTDPAVLEALRTVPREAFVPPELAELAYDDMPLPIGEGQTISQPSIVALMAAALRPSPPDRVLEIGTGSGYATAVLHGIVREVYTVERLEILYRLARRRLRRLGYHKVAVHHGNGTLGWPAHAPYDGIVVTAGGPTIPVALQEQLALGGRLGDAGGRPAHAAEACARDTRQCRRVPAGGAGLCMLCATDWRAGMGRRHGSAAIWRGRTPTSMKHWHRASESIQQRWQR